MNTKIGLASYFLCVMTDTLMLHGFYNVKHKSSNWISLRIGQHDYHVTNSLKWWDKKDKQYINTAVFDATVNGTPVVIKVHVTHSSRLLITFDPATNEFKFLGNVDHVGVFDAAGKILEDHKLSTMPKTGYKIKKYAPIVVATPLAVAPFNGFTPLTPYLLTGTEIIVDGFGVTGGTAPYTIKRTLEESTDDSTFTPRLPNVVMTTITGVHTITDTPHFTLKDSDKGKYLRMTITVTDSSTPPVIITKQTTSQYIPQPPLKVVNDVGMDPTKDPWRAVVGQTYQLYHARFKDNIGTVSFTDQWQTAPDNAGNPGTWSDVPGETGATFTLPNSVGTFFRVKEILTDAGNGTSITSFSNPFQIIKIGP